MKEADIDSIRKQKLADIEFERHLNKQMELLRERRAYEFLDQLASEKKLPKSSRPTHLIENDSYVATRETNVVL